MSPPNYEVYPVLGWRELPQDLYEELETKVQAAIAAWDQGEASLALAWAGFTNVDYLHVGKTNVLVTQILTGPWAGKSCTSDLSQDEVSSALADHILRWAASD